MHRSALLIALAVAACADPEKPAPTPTAPAAVATQHPRNFELACAPSNTQNQAELFCVRTDTRTGDAVNVNIFAIPVSNGPTREGDGPAGRFTTVCDATSTTQHSDFYCIRMNTESGELMMINLQKIGAVPAASAGASPSIQPGGIGTNAKIVTPAPATNK